MARFDWASALKGTDRRRDYGEARFLALGKIDGRVHLVIYTILRDRLRIISLRKANARERKQWENDQF